MTVVPLRDESGFTIIEVVSAAALLLLIVAATLAMLTDAEQSVAGSQRRENAISVAQREIEAVRLTRYAQLGLSSAPTGVAATAAANPSDPREYVSGDKLLVRSDFRLRTSAPPPGVAASGEELVLDGDIVTGPEFVQAGRDQFIVHRFISWVDRRCVIDGVEQCAGVKDAKRITVAVAAVADANVKRASKPVWVSTVLTDPSAAPPATTVPPAGPTGNGETAQSFYLYDTRCSSTARVAPVASHETHDTARTGALCSGTESTQSDLMGIAPPPSSAPVTPYWDLSSEVSRPTAAGAVLRRVGDGTAADSTTCRHTYADADADTGRQSVHRWVSTPVTAAFAGGGRAALSIWTRSLEPTSGPGRLCLTVGRMTAAGTIVATRQDVSHALALWPVEPTQVAFAFDQQPALSLAVGERLVVALSLHDASDLGAIEILYDHPDRESAIAMGISTPIVP